MSQFLKEKSTINFADIGDKYQAQIPDLIPVEQGKLEYFYYINNFLKPKNNGLSKI